MKGFNTALNAQVEAIAAMVRQRNGMNKAQPPKFRHEDCRDCNKLGYITRNSHYDKLVTASDVCPTCNGKGFVRIVIKGE